MWKLNTVGGSNQMIFSLSQNCIKNITRSCLNNSFPIITSKCEYIKCFTELAASCNFVVQRSTVSNQHLDWSTSKTDIRKKKREMKMKISKQLKHYSIQRGIFMFDHSLQLSDVYDCIWRLPFMRGFLIFLWLAVMFPETYLEVVSVHPLYRCQWGRHRKHHAEHHNDQGVNTADQLHKGRPR